MKFNLPVSALLLAVASCQPPPKEDQATKVPPAYRYDFSLVEQKTKTIQVDTFTKDRLGEWGVALWQTAAGKWWLANFNDHTNGVQLYNWATGKLEHTVPLAREGPHGVGEPLGCWFLDDSTLMVPQRGSNSLILVDFQGRVRQKYRQNHKTKVMDPAASGYVYSGEPLPIMYQPIFRVGTKLYMGVAPDLNPTRPSFYEHGRVAMVFDTATQKATYHTRYPGIYRAEGNFTSDAHRFVSWAYDPQRGKLTYSFPADMHLYVTDTSFRQAVAHEAQSQLAPGPVKFKAKPEEDELKFYKANHHFKSLFFDPYRRVYYRLVHLPARPVRVATEDGEEVREKNLVSVIVLDDLHRVIGETELPFPLGMVGAVLIDHEGLWLEGANLAPSCWPNGKSSFSENEIVLTLFTLHENQK